MSTRGCIVVFSAIVFLATASGAARAGECPVRVSSVVIEGKGLAGNVDRYRIVLVGASKVSASSATIGITVRGAASPLSTKVAGLNFTGADGKYWTSVTFLRPTADVTAVALISATPSNSDAVTCADAPVAIGGRGLDEDALGVPVVVVSIDDATVRPTIGLDATTGPTDLSAKSLSHVDLSYPQIAMDKDNQGTVIVGTRVAAEGKPQSVWIDRSSGDKLLDATALRATASSTYRRQEIDGLAVTTTLQVTDEFRIDWGMSAPEREALVGRACDASIGMLLLQGTVQGPSVRWYDGEIGGGRHRQALADITLAVDDASGRRNVLWSHIPAAVKTESGDAATGIAMYWPGAYATSISVQSTRRVGTSRVNSCPDVPSYVDNTVHDNTLVAALQTDKPALVAPDIEAVLQARFVSLAWPKFSRADVAGNDPIAVTVDVRTSDSGIPIAAFVRDAQFTPIFSRAALNAAMASTYRLPLAPDGSPFTHSFEIEYVYDPAK